MNYCIQRVHFTPTKSTTNELNPDYYPLDEYQEVSLKLFFQRKVTG